MSGPLLFVLASLTSYRLWRLWALDDLPPAQWVRERVERLVDRWFGAEWAAGVVCSWCVGFHICVAVWLAVWHTHPLPLPWLWPAAMSTALGLMVENWERQ